MISIGISLRSPTLATVLPLLIAVPALLIAVSAAAQLQDALFAGADVVVLTGLPGDVESESTYEAQTRRLLEILALADPAPERVVILNDTGTLDGATSGVEVRQGNLKGFGELAGELEGSTRPLVVLAWGHGGVLGRGPVFHVRGPRLQPFHFQTLAGTTSGPVRLALMFRESGRFARSLRGLGREILSSEQATPFKSDPIGMELVLEILRETPDLAFAELAERLGPATLEWYEGQSLARQEEPTLWSGDDPPRTLAVAESRIATVGGGATGEVSEPEPAGEPEPATTEIADEPVTSSPGWDGLEPVDARRWPGASAVVARRVTSYILANRPALTTEVDEFIHVLTPEGTVHGDVDISYSPPSERLTFLDLEVRAPDGTIRRLPPNEVRDATARALPEYRPPTRKIFSLPDLVPGAVMRVHYRREWQSFPLPHIPLEIPLAAGLPVASSRVSVRVGKDVPLHWGFRNHERVEPEIRHTPTSVTHTWSFADLAAPPDEVLAPPRPDPALLVTTFPSWEEYGAWYRRLIQLADEPTAEIAAKAAELTRHAADDRAKVEAVYNWVTNLRYVAIEFGVNSHRPHAAENVFRNRYGDCKDKANLFNTMLGTLGIDAHLALVPRFSQAWDELPGLGFNHAVSRVRLGDEVIWADTTDDTARFGLLPPGDPGRRVLVIDDTTSGLVEMPRPMAEDHRLDLLMRIDLSDEPHAAVVDVITLGYPDYDLRSAARALAGRSRTRPLPFLRLEPLQGVFALEEQEHTPAARLARKFTWNGVGTFSGLRTPLGEDAALLQAPFALPTEWRAALHRRSTPLYVNRGYPLILVEEITFVPPVGMERPELPAPQANDVGPLRWSVTWTREAAGRRPLVARLEAVLERGELSLEETRTFQEQLRRLYGALSLGATYGLR